MPAMLRLRRLHRQLEPHPAPPHPASGAAAPPTGGGPVTMTIPLEGDGPGTTRWGHLEVPDPSIMASTLVPICVVAGSAPGRTALLLAGNHGNEYEGQVALRRLAHAVDPAQLQGRLIIVPTISMAASAGWVREWPDGTNFNRVMPGRSDGNEAEQLAHFLSAVLIPASDIVFDLHTGGHNMRIHPSTMLFATAEEELPHHQEEAEAALAMLAPMMMLKRQPPLQVCPHPLRRSPAPALGRFSASSSLWRSVRGTRGTCGTRASCRARSPCARSTAAVVCATLPTTTTSSLVRRRQPTAVACLVLWYMTCREL